MIEITPLHGDRYKVIVDKQTKTSHIVAIQSEDYQRLTGGNASHEELLRQSFQFLLEREPNTSILREFDLMSIQRYFPEYERTIKSRLSAE